MRFEPQSPACHAGTLPAELWPLIENVIYSEIFEKDFLVTFAITIVLYITLILN